jgi:RsiW-degrading membrane proteinase PrsW (M82 family)
MNADQVTGTLLLLIAAFVPSLAVLFWLRWGVRGKKERWDDLILTFIGGAVVAVIIATILELIAAEFLYSTVVREYQLFVREPTILTFLAIIVVAPFIEEFAKVLVVRNFSRYIWRPRNGLIFGAACGLGFAATENFLYESTVLFEEGLIAFLVLAFVRSISSSLMHAASTSVSGYGVARAKSYGVHWWPYYLIAVLMHASFNLFASLGEFFSGELGAATSVYGLVISVALVVVAFLYLRWRISGYNA